MLNKKKALISLLCVIIFLFNITVNTFAINITNDENVKSNDIVYLTEGQGSEWAGNGSKSNPYRNIKTALKNVNPGGTIKITGKVNYWKYEETSDLLYRPLIIDKEVTIEGAETNNEFIVRAPIQLGADVTFKNINLQFWASNELMPGVPDSGMPQTPIDEWTTFRSGRTIYLAGYKLTLQSVDTRIPTETFQRDYRPFISGGTFRNEGTTGNKAVLDVIDANVYSANSTVLGKTEFAGIYAGDYWVERDYPVELNVKGRVLDRTIHTGGIMVPSKSEVTINLSNNTGVRTINTEKHEASADLNIIDGAGMLYANLNGIRNLNIGSGSRIEISENSKFEVENITLKSNSLLDFTNLTGNPIVKGDFTGENSSSDVLAGGAIFLNDNQTLDISGDVKGTIKLNYFNDINRVPLKENHLYIKAKENATGDFIINPQYNQSNFRLERNDNDLQRTTWTAVKDKDIFKDFIWIGNTNDIIPIPENTSDYLYHVKYINEKNESYIPIGDDWNEFIVTLEKPDGTILDTVNNDWDFDLSIGMYDDVVCVYFVNTSFTGELILTLNHISGKSISKKIQVGNINNAGDPVINGADNTTIKFGDVDEFNKDLLDGITVTDDKDTIDPKSIKVDGQVGKPLPGTDGIYKITYEVTDNDNNTTTVYRMVTVTNRLPEIVANDIEIKAGNSINLLTDGRIGLNATDHEDGNKKTDITLKSTGELNQSNPSEGTYRVTYEVEDNDGNIVEKDIIVTVISNKKPTIDGADNITIKLGQVDNFDLLDGIIVTDDHDKNLVATTSGTINKPSAGTNLDSQITYTVEDSDGNVTTVTRVITVTNQLPTIDGLSDITIKQGETFDLRAGVTANDNEDGIISDRIVLPNVDLSTLNVGKHEITYKVTDSDNNTVTKTRVVNVEKNSIVKTDLIGSDRYATATKISKEGWASAKSVILVNGYDKHLVDGLTATPLATALDAPILLSRDNTIPQTTVDEIKRLNPSNVIVIGGTTAINESVINQLRSINKNMSVKRISGKTRYETSLNIAKELDAIVPIKKIYVGAGNGEADSLSISPVAGRDKSPIILTAKNGLDTNTYNYLKSKKLSDAYFIGGATVISDNVINQVNGIVSKNVLGNRIAGINRRETNANVIKKFYPETSLKGAIIAKDLDLVDALAVGPLAAKRGTPVILAQNSLSAGQETVLKSKITNKLYQAGGGVSQSVLESLIKLLAN